MTYQPYKYQSQSKLQNLLTPDPRLLATPVKSGNVLPMRPPMSQRTKDSPSTSYSRYNQRVANSRKESFSNSFLEFTPVDSRYSGNHNQADFNLRAATRHTPNGEKYRNTLNTNQTLSEFSFSNKSMRVETYEELEELRKQNQELKRRLSLKMECSCKAPYVQEEVEYLRDCFYKHLETHHKEEMMKM